MSTIHLVGGEKGGVGKSVVARLLTQLFIDRSLPFAAFDADLSHGALLRYYADFAQSVDLAQLDSADQIMDSAVAARRSVIVDLPAQSLRALQRWLDTTDVLQYAREAGVRRVSWHVTDGGFDLWGSHGPRPSRRPSAYARSTTARTKPQPERGRVAS